MQRSRLAALMVFAGVVVVLASMGLLSSVTNDWEQGNSSRGLQKSTVNVDRSVTSAKSAGLKLKDADQLAKEWHPLPISYSAREQTKAAFGSAAASCDVFGVNGNYRDFTEIKMKSGNSIAQVSVDEHSRVTVISAQVADQLFHSEQVVGKTIELFGVAFTVIGVFDDDGSLLRQMSDDGIPDVLIPVTAMFDVYPEERIDTVQLAAKPIAAVGGEDEVKAALTAIGNNPSQFRVENDVLAHARIAQLRSMLLFGCGSITVFLLASLIIRQFRLAHGMLQRRLATDNWMDAILNERYRLLKISLAAGGMTAFMVGLWELTRFHLYIPPDWVPEQIIDVSFYVDKLRLLWQQQADQAGYVPSPQELLTDAASRLSGRLFFTGAMLGLPLFLLGLRLWNLEQVPVYVQLQRLFLYTPVAAVVAFAAARLAGMYYQIEPLEYAVPVALFIVSIVHFNHNHSEGVKISYVENHS